jgi:hypothetical protein
MYKKMRSRLLSAIAHLGDLPRSASQEKKHVLEDVFWVPANNPSSRASTSCHEPELHSEKLHTGEAAVPGDIAINTTRKRIRERYLF